jgi:hypothetical protein
MTDRLSWDSLFSQDPSIDFGQIFACWPNAGGKVLPIGMSAFGDVFYAKPDGSVWRLDSFTGQSKYVASSNDEFGRCMNTEAWQIENLRTALVLGAHSRGLTRGPAQVFAPAPHPIFSGDNAPFKFAVLDATVWHHISSQAVRSGPAGDAESQPKPWWKLW